MQDNRLLTKEELELVVRCVRKEKEAWDEFVDLYSRFIYNHVYRCLRARCFPCGTEDVEDLHHSVFAALLEDDCKKLRQFQGRCSLLSWIRLITTNIVIDYLRRQRAHVPLDAEDKSGGSLRDRLSDPGLGAEDEVMEEQRLETLKRALKELTPEDRLLAVLTYQRQMPVEEIADVLGISREAVYTRRHRLKEKLREAVEEKESL